MLAVTVVVKVAAEGQDSPSPPVSYAPRRPREDDHVKCVIINRYSHGSYEKVSLSLSAGPDVGCGSGEQGSGH